MRKFLLLLLFLAFTKQVYSLQYTPNLSVSYFGEFVLTHPGVMVGTGLTLAEKGASRFLLSASAGWYIHPRNHSGLFLLPEAGWQRTGDKGFVFETKIGFGYLAAFPAAPVYSLTDGQLTELSLFQKGSSAIMPSLSFGFGWDWEIKKAVPLYTFFKIMVFGQYPFNQTILPHTSVIIGVNYRFQSSEE